MPIGRSSLLNLIAIASINCHEQTKRYLSVLVDQLDASIIQNLQKIAISCSRKVEEPFFSASGKVVLRIGPSLFEDCDCHRFLEGATVMSSA
jgi:predicted HicB family RNase H-like nuclease